jgi:pyruvate dehydrogenase E2 component (dihydrolipoamide acetyltransferase)
MTEVTMPRLSDSMEQGTILTWLKADGEQVEAGEDLLEIETDKATVTHPADASGILQIVAPEGTTLQVGALIAHIGVVNGAPATPSPPADHSSTQLRARAEPSGDPSAAEAPARAAAAGNSSRAAVRATPLARRVAKAHGVPLEVVDGSGPLGRVTRRDVLTKAGISPSLAPASPRAPAAPPVPGKAPASREKGSVDVVELNALQALIARRMAEATAAVPHFQVQTEVVMDAAVAFRAQLKDAGASAPSFNVLIVKAAALALRDHPLANGAYRDGRFELYSRVNVGIAVAADHALVVPTIFDADQKSLGTIADESRRLAARVRAGKVTPSELSGATFTVSNLGMYGMTAITPVINPPQAAILGVGAMRKILARAGDDIVDRTLMTLTLSCDHRILYGADAAAFLARVRELLETPLHLAL